MDSRGASESFVRSLVGIDRTGVAMSQFERSRVANRICAGLRNSGIEHHFRPSPREDNDTDSEVWISTGRKLVRVMIYSHMACINGRPGLFHEMGIPASVMPGAPGQKKTIGRGTVHVWGQERDVNTRVLSPTTVGVHIYFDDDESEEIRHMRDLRRSEVDAKSAQENANKHINSLPRSHEAFVNERADAAQSFINPLVSMMGRSVGGYTFDKNDLDDFRVAMRNAVNVLRNSSANFSTAMRQSETMDIVDEQIDRLTK
jgi:hypothetical protein